MTCKDFPEPMQMKLLFAAKISEWPKENSFTGSAEQLVIDCKWSKTSLSQSGLNNYLFSLSSTLIIQRLVNNFFVVKSFEFYELKK